jgi:hypothetical protein
MIVAMMMVAITNATASKKKYITEDKDHNLDDRIVKLQKPLLQGLFSPRILSPHLFT